MQIKMIDGIPHWVSPEGLALPMMMGGQDWGTPPTGGGLTLDSVVGRTFLDLRSNFAGVVRSRVDRRTGSKVYWLSGAGGRAYNLARGAQLVDPNTREVYNLGAGARLTVAPSGIQAGGKLSEEDLARLFGGVGGAATSAASAPAYTSTQPYIESQRTWEAEEARKKREWEAAEAAKVARLLAENEALLQARSDLRAIAGTAETIRAGEREGLRSLWAETQNILGETLGKDVVRGAIRGQGMLTRGETPMAGYRTGVRGMGEAAQTALEGLQPIAAPNLNVGLPETQAQIEQYQRWAQPREIPSLAAPEPFMGMAEGGSLGPGGITMGTRKRAILLGEGDWSGDEEVGIYDPQVGGITEVIPIAGGAAGGAVFDPAAFKYKYDPGTIGKSMASIYEHLGFKDVPRATLGPKGYLGFEGLPGEKRTGRPDVTWGLPVLSRLGVQPRLMSNFITGEVFYREPDGTLRYVTSPALLEGYGPKDVVQVAPEELAGQRFGPPLTERPPELEPGVSRRRFPPLPEPLTIGEGPEELRNMLWPAPRTFASMIRNVSPSTRAIIASALGLLDYLPQDVEEELAYFSPRGTARAPRAALLA